MSRNRPNRLFLTTTRLLTYSSKKLTGVATGFFFEILQIGHTSQYIVTNKHVVHDKEKITIQFLEGSDSGPVLGKVIPYYIENPEDEFITHEKYDLAILPMDNIFKELSKKQISISPSFISSSSLVDHRTPPIDDVYFVGYPDGLWDTYNFLPILRKGVSATLLDIDYGGKKRFLIDANTIPGSSGSPIFVKDIHYEYDQDNEEIDYSEQYRFAGILSKRLIQRPTWGTEEVPIPLTKDEYDLKTNINIGAVIKSIVLYDFVRSFLRDKGLLFDWF